MPEELAYEIRRALDVGGVRGRRGPGGDMRRFRFFPSSILSFFWGSPLEKGEEFKTTIDFSRMHWYSRNVLLEIRVMFFVVWLEFTPFVADSFLINLYAFVTCFIEYSFINDCLHKNQFTNYIFIYLICDIWFHNSTSYKWGHCHIFKLVISTNVI